MSRRHHVAFHRALRATLAGLALLLAPAAARAQMDHSAHAQHAAGAAPTSLGQDAYAAIAEIVRLLDADPSTDWSKVNLEALRQHLRDMHEVTLRSAVAQRDVPGGFTADVTGDARTAAAIGRMLVSHARELDAMPELRATTEPIAGGVRLTVTAEGGDARAVARLRGLGMVGVLTLGDHHRVHHVMMARGGGH